MQTIQHLIENILAEKMAPLNLRDGSLPVYSDSEKINEVSSSTSQKNFNKAIEIIRFFIDAGGPKNDTAFSDTLEAYPILKRIQKKSPSSKKNIETFFNTLKINDSSHLGVQVTKLNIYLDHKHAKDPFE